MEQSTETGSPALARITDPDTSHAAAESLETTELETKVLEVIASFGEAGCIADDVYKQLPNLSIASVSPRFAPLVRKGKVNVIGKRPAPSGRKQRVMQAASKAAADPSN